jgi:hypothetical protein
MWYTILITLVVDLGGLLLIYALLRDRLRRAASASTQIAELRDEVSRLVIELNQTTDRSVALLEDRIANLNDLSAAADKKMGLLRREIEKHDMGNQVYSRIAAARPSTQMGNDAARSDRESNVARSDRESNVARSDRESNVARSDRESNVARSDREDGAAQRSTRAQSLSVELYERTDLQQRVVMLHKTGLSPALIATRLGVPAGEVELILSLEQMNARGFGAVRRGSG